MNLANTFGENLSKEMKKRQLTHKSLADLAGIAESSIDKYAAGKRLPTMEAGVKIANALGIPIDYLIKTESIRKTSWVDVRGAIMCAKCGNIVNDPQTWKYIYCPRCGRRNKE